MSGKSYLLSVLFLIALDALVGTIFYTYLESTIFNQIYLVLFFLLDLVFISTNLRKLRFTSLELLIIGILTFHLLLGIFVLPHYSISYDELTAFKDTLLPIMFLMKCIIFRNIFYEENFYNYKKVLIYSCVFIVLVQVLLLIFSPDMNNYAGINPPVNILLAAYFAGGPFIFLALTLIAIFLAGKRSILVSLALTVFIVSGRLGKFTFFACLGLVTGYILVMISDVIYIPLADKIIISFDAILQVIDNGLTSEEREFALYIATAGRSAEFLAILAFMDPVHWITGVGPGYSFELIRPGLDSLQISNAHFTPLAITYKFGVIIAFYFLFYVTKNIIWGLKNKEIFISSMLILFLIQSFFSFNIFAEILYPLFIGWLMVLRKNRKVWTQN